LRSTSFHIGIAATAALFAVTTATLDAKDARARLLCPVDVAQPVAALGAFQGNIAAHPTEVLAALGARALAIVREGCPSAQLVQSRGGSPLLIATIVQWKPMRTDDPIGALIGPRSSLVIRLQLLNADVARNRELTFENRARFTLNQPIERLVNDRFDKAVRRLLTMRD